MSVVSGACVLVWYDSQIWTPCCTQFCHVWPILPWPCSFLLQRSPPEAAQDVTGICSLVWAGLGRESLVIVLRVNGLPREFTLDFSSLPDSILSRDTLVQTAGFHSLDADSGIMIQIGLGYEMKPWEGILIRLLRRAEKGIEIKVVTDGLVGIQTDSLSLSSSSYHH